MKKMHSQEKYKSKETLPIMPNTFDEWMSMRDRPSLDLLPAQNLVVILEELKKKTAITRLAIERVELALERISSAQIQKIGENVVQISQEDFADNEFIREFDSRSTMSLGNSNDGLDHPLAPKPRI
ncbi:MAG: hypothetical protein WCP03_02450 [Candidatus Saccharibacteria bacterium]